MQSKEYQIMELHTSGMSISDIARKLELTRREVVSVIYTGVSVQPRPSNKITGKLL